MDPKLLALAHFEKVVLAGFAGWLLFALVGFVGSPSELSMKSQIDEKVKKIEDHMKGSSIPAPGDPGWKAKLAEQLDPSTLAAAAPAPGWLMHRRPKLLYQQFSTAVELKPKHSPPYDLVADGSERGKVKLRWKLGENDLVVCSYELSRKKGQDGAWESIGTTNAGVYEFTDEKVASRSTYFYKVTSIAQIDQADPRLNKVEVRLPDEEARKESGEVGPIATARDIYVIPSSVIEVTDEDLKKPGGDKLREEAQVNVYRFDPATNSFQKKGFRVLVGGEIGEVTKVRVGGKSVDVDFRAGGVLDDVWVEKRMNAERGYEQSISWIRIRYPDGSTEEVNDRKEDRPAELPKN